MNIQTLKNIKFIVETHNTCELKECDAEISRMYDRTLKAVKKEIARREKKLARGQK